MAEVFVQPPTRSTSALFARKFIYSYQRPVHIYVHVVCLKRQSYVSVMFYRVPFFFLSFFSPLFSFTSSAHNEGDIGSTGYHDSQNSNNNDDLGKRYYSPNYWNYRIDLLFNSTKYGKLCALYKINYILASSEIKRGLRDPIIFTMFKHH